MKHGKWKPLCLLALVLCLLAATACAEKMTLAFGYEIDLPEGVEITGEAWTPENHALMYLLTGTYQNGVEQFRLRVNYGFEHQLKTGKAYAGSINVSIEDISSFYTYLRRIVREEGHIRPPMRIDQRTQNARVQALFSKNRVEKREKWR